MITFPVLMLVVGVIVFVGACVWRRRRKAAPGLAPVGALTDDQLSELYAERAFERARKSHLRRVQAEIEDIALGRLTPVASTHAPQAVPNAAAAPPVPNG